MEETRVPMNPEEIWSYAQAKGYAKDCGLSGKTPSHTIGARIYVDIDKNAASPFYKHSTKPQKFGLIALRGIYGADDSIAIPADASVRTFKERDLHPLLVAFVRSDEHFKAYAKTIRHERSLKTRKNAEMWMHPDIVAVHYAFEDFKKDVVELASTIGQSPITLFSFELKKSISPDTVRECFFQAVSNSSWANEGYLVAPEISDEALGLLGKLNASFGIGVIRLDLQEVSQSEILIPSRCRETLDLGMMDELVGINPDFQGFMRSINKTLKTDEPVGSHYDELLDFDELAEHCARCHVFLSPRPLASRHPPRYGGRRSRIPLLLPPPRCIPNGRTPSDPSEGRSSPVLPA